MTPSRTTRRRKITFTMLAISTLASAVGCGSDDDTTATSAPPDSTVVTSTTVTDVDPAASIESLSYLMQGLLTTPQIGGGWIDMGRVVIPPTDEPTHGPLCPEGAALAEPIGTTLNAQVHASYRRESLDGTTTTNAGSSGANPVTVSVTAMETLLWDDRQTVDAAFSALAAAVDACVGQEWSDPDMGDTVMTEFDAPPLGSASFAVGYRPVTPPSSDPWAETQGISILLSDEGSPASIVITVTLTVVHDSPDGTVGEIDTDELVRIAEVAIDRILDGL